MADFSKYRMHLVFAHIDSITSEINDVNREIENLISSDTDYKHTIQFLMTIPSVKRDSTISIFSEIGIDISPFYNSKLLCCWDGLTLGNKKSVRITCARSHLRPALVQCVHATIKSNKPPYYKKK